MGHIDMRSEEGRRLGEVANAVIADKKELEREFCRKIGARTFRLLRRIGQENSSTFHYPLSLERINTVRTSKPFGFTLPGQEADFSLRLEVNHMAQTPLLKMFPPRTFYEVGAELTRHGQADLRIPFSLSESEFVNGTAIRNHEAGYSRGAVQSYSQRTAIFINLLDFAEELLDGSMPADVPEASVVFSAFGITPGNVPEIEA